MNPDKKLTPFPMSPVCACKNAQQGFATPPPVSKKDATSWNIRYFLAIAALTALWCLTYANTLPAASWLTSLLGIAPDTGLGASVEFFFYDTAKILLLLVAMIYTIGWARASMQTERIRSFLAGKGRGLGYLLGSAFGAVTPFCSCSSIPLFLGFTSARIPMGVTMAFLITSPLINEIAVVLLWGLLGWKFTIIYVSIGMGAGILGGWCMDRVRAERWLQPFVLEALESPPVQRCMENGAPHTMTVRQRHAFAYGETRMIFQRVWKWVFIGVGIGAALHGFVPENWFAEHLGAGEWWTVPMAVCVGIPLYSNVTGIIPVMQSLLIKGMPIGTTLAFCMSSVAASIPEFLMLRQVMTWRLQAAFIGYLWIVFTLAGWVLNALGPYIR